MILTHLILFRFWTGAGQAVVYPSQAAILPDSTAMIAHARLLREYRDQAVAARIHNILKETTA